MKTRTLAFQAPIKKYYSLTKPGVLWGNVMTAVAGFLFASAYLQVWDTGLFFALLVGITLIVASACVLNNYLDRDIDSKMERTKDRATVTGAVGVWGTMIYSLVLGIIGLVILSVYTNVLTALLAFVGFLIYVFLYGMWSKRRSMYGTLVGAVSGAVPILAGYTAVIGAIDPGAILIFLALFYWQIPEFFSIAIYRKDEYKKAGVPVVSVSQGVEDTKKWIIIGTIAFVVASLLLTLFDYTGYVYFAVLALLGIVYVWYSLKGLGLKKKEENDAWARKMFRFSLWILTIYSVAIAVGPLLP